MAQLERSARIDTLLEIGEDEKALLANVSWMDPALKREKASILDQASFILGHDMAQESLNASTRRH